MSESSERGKAFEKKIAKILRQKLGVKVERDKRSGAGHNKQDISDWMNELPIKLELKDQKTIKVREWMRQAVNATVAGQVPVMAFATDDETLACIRFSDLLDFLVEIRDQKAEIALLRRPVHVIDEAEMTDLSIMSDETLEVGGKVKKSHYECRGGHVSDKYGYCQQLTCGYSRGYKIKKGKR